MRLWKGQQRRLSPVPTPSKSTEMAATEEPIDDEYTVAGPILLSRLEVKYPGKTLLINREMESPQGISRNSLMQVTTPPKALLTRNSSLSIYNI
jgi:hypothetical protein